MASVEAENPPETLPSVSVNEPQSDAEELIVSESSVLSHSYEPKLSAIVEENGLSEEKITSLTRRFEQLARPKLQHLEETLERFESIRKQEMNERILKIKTRLRELRGSEKHARQINNNHLTGNQSIKLSRNSELLYNNLQYSLRKAAFEMLANQIFDKIPELIVKMQHTRAQQMAPEMKTLLDTLEATLVYYIGQPANEYEERVFNRLCYGLAKFIEHIIENVHKNQQESERVAQNGKASNGHFPVAVQLARKAYKEHQ